MFGSHRPGGDRSDTPGPQPGVVVLAPDRKRYFFPGGTAHAAIALARHALGAVLEDRLTRIEFGEAFGVLWTPSEVLKKSDLPEPAKPEAPQIVFGKGG